MSQAMQDEPKPSAGRLKQIKGATFEKLILTALKRQGLSPAIERRGLKATYRRDVGGQLTLQRQKSGCDYEGGYKARSTVFDAKSTKGKSLPMSDLSQTVRIKKRHAEGWLAFYLVEFSDLPDGPEYYALTWPALQPYWDRRNYGGRLSVPLAWFQQTAYRVKFDRNGLDLADLLERMHQGMRP